MMLFPAASQISTSPVLANASGEGAAVLAAAVVVVLAAAVVVLELHFHDGSEAAWSRRFT
jgi:hypothetical protein